MSEVQQFLTKVCKLCKVEKLLKEFWKHPTCKLGVSNMCKTCQYTRNNEYRKQSRNRHQRAWEANHPWYRFYSKLKQRCENPRHSTYASYGGKGIKALITLEEVKYLWFRDRAFELKEPSVDRIDPKKDYSLDNCRFIELTLNKKLRWAA